MKPDIERRFVTTDFEVRSQGDTHFFEGYALMFERKSQNLGGFREKVAHGAVTKTIAEADIRALFNHDPNMILGRNRAGTLDLTEDSEGLHYRTSMPDTSYARDLLVSMERGDVTQSSFGFRVVKDDWGIDEDEFPIRTLREIALFDVSPVTYPAYLDSTSGVSKRSLDALEAFRAERAEPDPVSEGTTRAIQIPSDADVIALRARMLSL
jgi:HK97 family phage prohead protease